jgi:hypothetical protein
MAAFEEVVLRYDSAALARRQPALGRAVKL